MNIPIVFASYKVKHAILIMKFGEEVPLRTMFASLFETFHSRDVFGVFTEPEQDVHYEDRQNLLLQNLDLFLRQRSIWKNRSLTLMNFWEH